MAIGPLRGVYRGSEGEPSLDGVLEVELASYTVRGVDGVLAEGGPCVREQPVQQSRLFLVRREFVRSRTQRVPRL
jgi:hypothetical protein